MTPDDERLRERRRRSEVDVKSKVERDKFRAEVMSKGWDGWAYATSTPSKPSATRAPQLRLPQRQRKRAVQSIEGVKP